LFLDCLEEGINGVDAVDQGRVEVEFGKIHAEFFFEENHDVHGVHGGKTAVEKRRGVVRKGLFVLLLEEQFFQELPNLFPVVHVFSSSRQVKKMRKKSKMFRDWIGPLGVIENVEQAVKKSDAKCWHNAPAKKSRGPRAALARLRNADGRGQHRAIENVDVKRRERAPQTKLGDVV